MTKSKQTLIEFFESRIATYDSFVNEWKDPDNIELAKKIRGIYEHLLKKSKQKEDGESTTSPLKEGLEK